MIESHKAASVDAFIQVVKESITHVLSQALGSVWHETATSEAPFHPDQMVRAHFCVTSGLRGELDFLLNRSDASGIALRFIGTGTGKQGEWTDEAQQALDELFRQVAGCLVSRLEKDFGVVAIHHSSSGGEPIESGRHAAIALQDSEGNSTVIGVRLSAELVECLESASSSALDPSTSTSPLGIREHNLNLLLGVELPATLRFGQKKMLLRDVLDLNTGSVIELDRQVQEPVELLLDGKIIARGEVVLVDGSYGLRVTEVASQKARLSFLD